MDQFGCFVRSGPVRVWVARGEMWVLCGAGVAPLTRKKSKKASLLIVVRLDNSLVASLNIRQYLLQVASCELRIVANRFCELQIVCRIIVC